jgi:hypothetical protein
MFGLLLGIHQSTNQPINQSTNQPINQSTNQPINQSTNQPINNTSSNNPRLCKKSQDNVGTEERHELFQNRGGKGVTKLSP